MRYTFLLYSEPSSTPPDPETMQRSMQAFGAYIGALKEAGIFVDTDWLQPGHTATTLTVNDGVRKVQDGPYADTKEQLGGYFVVEVDDLDTALDWALKRNHQALAKLLKQHIKH